MSDHQFKKQGLGYVLELPDIFTAFQVNRIHRSRDGLHGDLMVKTAWPGIKTFNGVMMASTFNITSLSIRRSIGKSLSDRNPVTDPKDQLDWYGFLEELCQGIMAAEREGEPIEMVGQLPDTARTPLLLDPVVDSRHSTILYGDSGTGKSMFALGLGVSYLTGQEVIPGVRPSGTGNVLYLDYETSREEVDRRVKAICNGANLDGVQMHYRRCFHPLHESVEELSRYIAENEITFVIVDPIGYAMGFTREGGDPAEPALRLFNALRMFDTTTLCVDHVGKTEPGAEGHKKPYGSSYKSHAARATWELRVASRPDTMSHIALYHQKHNNTAKHDPIGYSMYAVDGLVSWAAEPINLPDLTEGLSNADRIALALSEHGLRVREISNMTGINENLVRSELNRLRGKKFEKLVTGDWSVIEGGLS